MAKHILIIGSGFAGMMAALEASRLRDEKGISPNALTITVVSPAPTLVIRPRLYERNPDQMVASLTALFAATDINHEPARVESIDAAASTITIVKSDGATAVLPYDRLILAAGSKGFSPPIPGLAEFGFAPAQLEEAVTLDRHLQALASKPSSVARNTVVVGGAGFTGLEFATEMPARLRAILGKDAPIRVIIADRSAHVAAAMGNEPRPIIEERLRALGIETRLNVGITALDANGVTLSDGQHIETSTVVWSGGMRASSLTEHLPGERDNLGRIIVEPDLRVPGAPGVFATGDTAKARTDAKGNFAVMSCQHARRLGAFAGHNAAADLLGLSTLPYDQPAYVVCLDLGPDTAIFARGWESKVEVTGAQAKKIKQEINEVWIYPPAADRAAAYQNVLAARTIDF